jgi:hypothetical protein
MEIRHLPRYVSAPTAISDKLREIGAAWAHATERPRVSSYVKRRWEELIDAWAISNLPLIIRKSGGVRGAAVMHCSGREIVLADNSPAQWAFIRAYAGHAYSLPDIQQMLIRDAIPFAYATKTAEKAQMKFRCTLHSTDNVNKCGWKLCHIDDIGLSTRTPVVQLPLAKLVDHFKLFIKPSNHFLVPLNWAGLGEVREFIGEIRDAERSDT